MSVFTWLVWTLLCDALAGPVQHMAWSGVDLVKTDQDGATRPSFFHLPMFQHSPGPLVPRELFRPVPYKTPLPPGLTALLLPTTGPQQAVQETSSRAVDVHCGTDKISVCVDRFQLRAWTVPSLFQLGSCRASRISPRYLYFDYRLSECDGQLRVVGGQLVYTFILCYTPPPQETVIRVLPLHLPIHCYYNRFHYSYQVGFRPQVQHSTFMKSISSKLGFSLTVCNAQWEPLPPGHWFFLGEPVYFVAQAGALLAGERLYVDSCYATSSRDPNSLPKMDVITNHGCMTDSRREGSSSRFVFGGDSVLKFSVDAFLFRAATHVLYLHCSMSVHLSTSSTSKSCNYNQAAGRWEELQAPPSVCSCCNSICTEKQHSIENTVRSSGWFIGQEAEETPKMMSVQAEDERQWTGKEELREDRMKDVSLSLEEMEAIPEKRFMLPAGKRKFNHSVAVSQPENRDSEEGQREELIMEKADRQLEELATDGIIMSDQSRPEEKTAQDKEEGLDTKNVSVRALFSVKSITNASGHDYFNTTITTRNHGNRFGINDHTNDHGSAENGSSTVAPIIKLCPNSDKLDCNATNSGIKHEKHSNGAGTMYTVTSPEISTPYNVNATSKMGSLWDSRVHLSPLGSRLEIDGTLPSTRSFDIGSSGLPDVGKSRLGLDKSDTQKRSEQVRSVTKLVDSKSNRIPWRRFDSVNSKLNGEDGDILQSLHIRRLESDQSIPPAGFRDQVSLGGSDFDSGIEEGDVFHLSQFTGAVQDFSGTIPRLPSFSSGSVSPELRHQDSLSHSAVVIVKTSLQGSGSSQISDRVWAEVVPGWD